MLKTRVIPCLLLRNQGLVKTVKFKNPAYIGDPINAIRIFNDKEVDELLLLDITATVENRKPNFKVITDIASECFMPVGYGGGLRNIDDIGRIFSLGVEKVIINSYAHENPDFIRAVAEKFGSQSVVVSIDVKKSFWGTPEVYVKSGQVNTHRNPIEYAKQMEKAGAGEIFLNSIDMDGTMAGYDLDLIRQITGALSIPVIACGGAGKLEHFANVVRKSGASAVAAGSMFVFHGPHRAVLINYPERQDLEKHLE